MHRRNDMFILRKLLPCITPFNSQKDENPSMGYWAIRELVQHFKSQFITAPNCYGGLSRWVNFGKIEIKGEKTQKIPWMKGGGQEGYSEKGGRMMAASQKGKKNGGYSEGKKVQREKNWRLIRKRKGSKEKNVGHLEGEEQKGRGQAEKKGKRKRGRLSPNL